MSFAKDFRDRANASPALMPFIGLNDVEAKKLLTSDYSGGRVFHFRIMLGKVDKASGTVTISNECRETHSLGDPGVQHTVSSVESLQ